jgi:hypothetical protein
MSNRLAVRLPTSTANASHSSSWLVLQVFIIIILEEPFALCASVPFELKRY